jgi:hypothetical protein
MDAPSEFIIGPAGGRTWWGHDNREELRVPMNEIPKVPDVVRLVAEQQGLARALALFPDVVTAAAGRGLKPLGAPPEGAPEHIAPATVFDAEAATRR